MPQCYNIDDAASILGDWIPAAQHSHSGLENSLAANHAGDTMSGIEAGGSWGWNRFLIRFVGRPYHVGSALESDAAVLECVVARQWNLGRLRLRPTAGGPGRRR